MKQIHGVLYFSYSLHPTQPFFYITPSGFSHLKRRLLHLPACLPLTETAEVVQASLSCFLLWHTERGEEGEEGGRKEKRKEVKE